MTDQLRAALQGEAGEVVLRLTNAGQASVEVLNPDLGRPSPDMRWPHSEEAYRTSLLMSYGYLEVRVADDSGEPVDMAPVQTWATPALRPPVRLEPGESLDVPVPVGVFFPLQPGETYRVSVGYGAGADKTWAEAALAG
jgi:hypothetical protein